MSNHPSINGANGRGEGGRFAKGNSGGPGNPHIKRTAKLRALLVESVTDDDLRAVVAKLVESAKAGELPAIRELLDRLLGKPPASIDLAVGAEPTIRVLNIIEQVVEPKHDQPDSGHVLDE